MHAGTFSRRRRLVLLTNSCLSLFHCADVLVCNETFVLQGRLKSQTPNKRTRGAGPPPEQTSALPPFSSLSSRFLSCSPPGSAVKRTCLFTCSSPLEPEPERVCVFLPGQETTRAEGTEAGLKRLTGRFKESRRVSTRRHSPICQRAVEAGRHGNDSRRLQTGPD